MFKLGKQAAEFDNRDLLFKNVMRAVPVPATYDWDIAHPGVPMKMYLNDSLGDCVMAARAEQEQRFEFLEQQSLINITDEEVRAEYFAETGGGDDGLVISRSLKRWRQKGWIAGGKNYKISAYSRIALYNRSQLKAAVFADCGVPIGFEVFESAMDQFEKGQTWDVVTNQGSSLGGHCVLIVGYDTEGLNCITWGTHHRMTWNFWDAYTDEAWACIDANDTAKRQGLIDLSAIEDFLQRVK